MNTDFLKRFLWVSILIILQVFLLNHIHMFGIATPLLYVYFILLFPRNYPQWSAMLWAFAIGLTLDAFNNTPGVTAASLTLIAALQPFAIRPFLSRESSETLIPGMRTLGVFNFIVYIFVLTTIHIFTFFSLEMFSFFNLIEWAECAGASTALTILLILVIEQMRSRI